MKKISTLALVLTLLVGCAACDSCNPNKKNQFYQTNPTGTVQNVQSDFNQEHYIWENFIFTTNRVNQAK